MKHQRHSGHERSTADASSARKTPRDSRTPHTRHRGWKRFALVLIVIVVIAAVGRAMLPSFVQEYVNRTLDRDPLYDGRIGTVQIDLWRGAYSIHEVRISKVTGNVPVPFFEATQVDFAIQWNALIDGKVVGRVVMDEPKLNFVDAPDDSEDQTGAGAPWLDMIEELFPFRINSAAVKNGSIHFRAFHTETPVDVYISEVNGTIENLTNIRDETKPLVSTVEMTGVAMDQAKLEFKMVLDPFSYRPTFHLGTRLLGLDVTKLNTLARAYGNFDFEHGWFDLVIEADAKEGLLTGYAKPLFRDLDVFSLKGDLAQENPLRAFWQALVGAVTEIFKNQPRDQFGTLIPFSGDLTEATSADILATIGNILRNAFVRAYLPQLQGGWESVGGLMFEPPDLTDPISVGDSGQ